uniref:Uncharacterized protein n=1 Tax=Arundo donax TaxID=35708 RepID=A0A0A9E842_ARUDO
MQIATGCLDCHYKYTNGQEKRECKVERKVVSRFIVM